MCNNAFYPFVLSFMLCSNHQAYSIIFESKGADLPKISWQAKDKTKKKKKIGISCEIPNPGAGGIPIYFNFTFDFLIFTSIFHTYPKIGDGNSVVI